MRILWDRSKANANFAKHGIHFRDIETVFFDPRAIALEDLAAIGEQRLIVIGADNRERIVTVAYTLRGDDIRVISARKATRFERDSYEKGI